MHIRHLSSDDLPEGSVPGRRLADYGAALAEMDALVARPAHATDVILCAEHPPTITLGRHRGHDSVHGTTLRLPGKPPYEVAVHDVARGGAVTYHAPGQLVIYPIVQLPLLRPPLGGGLLGDLGQYVRALERCIVATCAQFGLETQVQPGRSGVWMGPQVKLASIGIGVRGGWTFHGLALNVNPHLSGFDLITPCALEGVTMTTLWRELEMRGLPVPSYAAVEDALVARLAATLTRA